MAIPQNLFRLLSEFIMLLLGALLILLSVSGSIGVPARPAALIGLGVVFIYWGAGAGMRRRTQKLRAWNRRFEPVHWRWSALSVLAIPLLSVRYAPLLLSIAGSILVLRGLLGVVFSFRRTPATRSRSAHRIHKKTMVSRFRRKQKFLPLHLPAEAVPDNLPRSCVGRIDPP